MSLNGLSNLNIELTSRCNKKCAMCGRRKIERDYPELAKWGDMDYELVKSISTQIPHGVVIQFHDNGEPLLYPCLEQALTSLAHCIRCMDTNGKLLVDKAGILIGNLETITVSVFEDDPEQVDQFLILKEFMGLKSNSAPLVIARILGDVNPAPYQDLGCIIATRVLHSPMGSFDYKKPPTVPEIGVCLDALHHLVVKRDGGVAMCVRFDPHREGIIGDANTQPLEEIWNGVPRKLALEHHLRGERDKIPLCRKCEYWGVPVGW